MLWVGSAVPVVAQELLQIEVTPRDRRIDLGQTKSMTATGTFTGGTTADVTDQVIWASRNPTVVIVSNEPGSRGHARAVGPGVASISATSRSGISSSDSGGDALVRVPARLVRIRILPREITLPVDFTRALDAEGTFSDGSVADISNDVTWATSASSIAVVSNTSGSQGEVTGRGRGVAVIRAIDPVTGISSTASGGDAVVTVAGQAIGLSIRPDADRLPVGLTRRFSVRVLLEDGSFFNLSRQQVQWSSSDPRIATVSNNSSTAGLVTAIKEGEVLLSAVHPPTGLRTTDSDADALVTVLPSLQELASLQVTPPDRRIDLGDTKSMTAIGTFDGGETADLTEHVFWASSDPNVVVVSNVPGSRGRATAVAPGVAFISASAAGVTSSSEPDGDARVRVLAELVSVRIVPGDLQLPVGFSRSLDAEGTFDNDTLGDISNKVIWSTSDPSVARVSNDPGSQGELTAVGDGTATISVVDPATGISSDASGGNAVILVAGEAVAISITPSDAQLPVGLTRRFSVQARLDDGSFFNLPHRSVEWTSSDRQTATVSNDPSTAGLVTAIRQGETILSAVHPPTGFSSADSDGNALVTVLPALDRLVSLRVTPDDRRIDIGETKSMTATGTFAGGETGDLTDDVLWESSDPSVVTVSNQPGSRGRATAVAPGIAFISASVEGGVSSTDSDEDGKVRVLAELVSIRIIPGTVRLPVGFSRSFDAEGTFHDNSVADISNKVIWSTSDPSVAEISNMLGSQGELIALNSGVTAVSALDLETGISSALSNGDAIVTVAGNVVGLSITPSTGQLPVGLSRKFSVSAILEDESLFPLPRRSVEWTSSNLAVATVSNDETTAGLVTGIAQGETTLSAVHFLTGFSSTDSDADALVTVLPPLEQLTSLKVTPPDRRIDLGEEKSMTATGTFTGGETGDITDHVFWESSDPSIVTVSNQPGSSGRATGVALGEAYISASAASVSSSSDPEGDGRVRVVARLVSIRIKPSLVQLPVGFARTFDAIGTFHNGSTADISNKVTWFESDPSVAVVSNELESQGEVIALYTGVAVISVVDEDTGISSTASGDDAVVEVAGRVVALSITPPEEELPIGLSRKFSARATLEDGSFFSISRRRVNWISSNPDVATVSNDDTTAGFVTAIAKGETILSAVHPLTGFSSTASDADARVIVPGRMVAIEIRPPERDLFIGQTKRFSTFALLEDGGDLKLSSDIEYITSDPSVATVSNASGRRGDTTGITSGTADISVVHVPSGLSSSTSGGDATASVGGLVETLRVDPSRGVYVRGTQQKIKARATFDDGSRDNIASDVIWTSSDPSIAEVGNVAPKKGVLMAKEFGAVMLSAVEPGSGVSTSDSDGDGTVIVVDQLERLRVQDRTFELRTGDRRPVTALGDFPNPAAGVDEPRHVEVDLTETVEWISSNPAVARVEKGEVIAVGLGEATVSARDAASGITSAASGHDATVRVIAALSRIKVRPRKIRTRVDARRHRAFTAIGVYTDRARIDITTQVDFLMADPTVARVSNRSDRPGVVSPFNPGKTKVTAVDPVTGVQARARRVIVKKRKR
jgi:uncharacterized protein YjdB